MTGASPRVHGALAIVGLGPAGLDRVAPAAMTVLLDDEVHVIVRTLRHPAATELASRRSVESCDDLYEQAGDFEEVYEGIVARVVERLAAGPVAYAVPGSVAAGELAARHLVAWAREVDVPHTVHPGASFLEFAMVATGVDAIADGVQVVDARRFPDPLPLHLPTFVTQVDSPLVLADTAVTLGRVLPPETEVTVLRHLGAGDESMQVVTLAELPRVDVDERTTLFVPATDVGLLGLVATNRVLRRECPWDAEQTHHSLVAHLVEEAYETVHAIAALPSSAPAGPVDFGAYAEVEEELGDLLLQVVFHATLAAEAGAFDVDEVAEAVRRKLVHRHPHVFGDVTVADAREVKANWEQIKEAEKRRASTMDGIPAGLPGITGADKVQRRAASVGFDWTEAGPLFDVVAGELAELREATGDEEREIAELGDVLFSVVNLARHLGVDPEVALARANDRFVARFRAMEELAARRGTSLRDLTAGELEELWNEAKQAAAAGRGEEDDRA